MKAIKIDPKTQTVSEIQLEGEVWKALVKETGGQLVDRVAFKDFDVWVDDEGLYAQDLYIFKMLGYTGIFFGTAVVCGYTPDGKTIEPKVSVEEIRKRVTFGGKALTKAIPGGVEIRSDDGYHPDCPLCRKGL